jgi:hypothetical protein
MPKNKWLSSQVEAAMSSIIDLSTASYSIVLGHHCQASDIAVTIRLAAGKQNGE